MPDILVVGASPNDARNHIIFDALDDLNEEYQIVTPPKLDEGKKKLGKKDLIQYTSWVNTQIERHKAKYVLLVGDAAVKTQLSGKENTLKRVRGRAFTSAAGVIFLATWSGAFIDYDERQKPALLSDLRLFDLIVKEGKIPQEDDLEYRIVRTEDDFEEMLEDLRGVVSFDLETTCLYPWAHDAAIWSVGFGTARQQWLWPIKHAEIDWTERQVKRMMRRLDEAVKEQEPFIVAQNGKFDVLWMWVHFGIRWDLDFDTMLAHYIVNENALHDLETLAKQYFGALDYDIDLKTKTGHGDLDKACRYQALDLLYTRKLFFSIKKELGDDPASAKIFYKIMMPCARLFVEIEHHGVYINLDQFDDAETYLREEIEKAEKELSKFGNLNWGSPKQVGKLLFEDLGIKPPMKTKTGANSTSESALKQIDHPCVAALLKFRGAKQQLSFFIEGWKPFLDGNRLHPSFKLHGTVTGRLSAEHPNLQQVPRDPRIRSLIGAPPGWELVEVDLSQIELRIAAELAQERTMLKAFADGVDVHWLTVIREIARSGAQAEIVKRTASTAVQRKVSYSEAIEILLQIGPDAAADIDPTWKELRKKAKAINFGYLYGMWWKKFIIYARDNYDVIVSEKDAQASREAFFGLYSDFPDWHERQRRFARRNGYVRSLSGRKRRLPAAMDPEDTPQRAEAQRQAINAPVQSFANELNLFNLLQIREEFPRAVMQPVGTVHDAILLEVRKDYVVRVTERLLEIARKPDMMELFGIELSVPIEADAKIGPWGKSVSLERWKAANKEYA